MKQRFWRVFGAALTVDFVSAVVSWNIDARHGAMIRGVFFSFVLWAIVLCIWATKAPWGAAIALLVLDAIGTFGGVFGVVLGGDPRRLFVAALNLLAAAFALRAVTVGAACRNEEARRERMRAPGS